MKKTVDGYIAKIDAILPDKITAQPVAQETPELLAVVEPKVIEPARELRLAQPKLAEAEAGDSAEEETAPKVPAPVAGEGTYIERKIKERNILRTYTATFVSDAAAKADSYMAKGDFAKARQAVQAA